MDLNHGKGIESRSWNIIIGLIWSFLLVLLIFIASTNGLHLTLSDIILYLLLISISSLGYYMVLLPEFQVYLRSKVSTTKKGQIYGVLFILLLLTVIFLTMNLMSEIVKSRNTDFIVLFAYVVYILAPLTVIVLLQYHSNSNLKLILYFSLFLWVWWAIEFKSQLGLFPNLIAGYSNFLNLLAFIILTWGLLVLTDHFDIPRSFSRLFSVSTFKVISGWTALLFIIIIPPGLITSFLTFNPDNLLNKGTVGAIGFLLLGFIAVFLVQGIGEEMLFRGFFFKFLKDKLEQSSEKAQRISVYALFFFLFWCISLTPFVGLANTITEGIVKDLPLEFVYPLIALIYITLGIGVYYRTKDIELSMVIWSSMLFGWAHFEDWRYMIFATIAGLGYCQTFRKTKNLYAASFLHMVVDVVWGAVLVF